MDREFEFDAVAQRYRIIKGSGKGQFIPYDAVASLTEQYIENSKVEIDDITNSLLNRSVTVSEWETSVAEQLKDAHINSYALGYGGIGRLGVDERLQISARLKDEFTYLRAFSEDILDGRLSEAQILNRSSMYLDSIHLSFEMGRESSHRLAGFDEERRVVNASEPCSDCINFETQGWQPIGTLPLPGNESQCLSRCRCHKEFRQSDGQESRLFQGNGWLHTNNKAKPMETNFRMQHNDSPIKNVGVPSDEQMAMINQHSPLSNLSSGDVTTLAFYASNNLLWHSNGAWTIPALMNMSELLKGCKFLLDHNWDEVGKAQGKVYDAQLLYSETAPEEAIDVAGMRDINEYIVERNGYARLILHAYFENDSQILRDFQYGRMDDVSTGVITSGDDSYICPVCSERFDRDVLFNEKDSDGLKICPHNIPTPFMLYWFGEDNEDMNFAPFYYRSLNKNEGAHGIELSAVVAPNLPATGIITPQKMVVI